MKHFQLKQIIREEIEKAISPTTLSEAEIQDRQKRIKEYNDNLDKMIELGKQLIKSYGREI